MLRLSDYSTLLFGNKYVSSQTTISALYGSASDFLSFAIILSPTIFCHHVVYVYMCASIKFYG